MKQASLLGSINFEDFEMRLKADCQGKTNFDTLADILAKVNGEGDICGWGSARASG